MSATSAGSGRSRPQLTPVRWKPSSLAPVTKSLIAATVRSAITVSPACPDGAERAGRRRRRSRISASVAKRNGSTPGTFAALISFSMWSPRTSSITICGALAFRACASPPPTSRSSRWEASAARPHPRRCACPGVATFVKGSAAASARGLRRQRLGELDVGGVVRCGHYAMASSPDCASTWNSCEPVPPISPVSAATARNLRPRRVKMRAYASYIAW